MKRLEVWGLLAWALMSICVAHAGAEVQDRQMSLGECVTAGLAKHPRVAVAEQRVLEAEGRLAARKGVKLPQVAFHTDAQRYDWLPGNKANILGGGRTDVYSAITLSKLLASSGRAEANIDSAYAALEASTAELRRARQDVAFSVSKAYYNVLRLEAILEARTEAVVQMQQHLKVAEERYAVGKAAKLDALRAEVQLADVTQAKLLAMNQVQTAKLELLNAMGIDDLSVRISPMKDVEPAPSFTDIDQFLDEAFRIHPDYLKAALLAKASEYDLRTARAESGPELSLLGNYNREGKDIPEIDNWNIGLSLTIPIYAGGITQANIKQADAALMQRRSNCDLVKQTVALEVASAVLATQDALNRREATGKSVDQARESLRVAQEKYSAGLGSSTEVIDAEVALVQAETNYTEAFYDGKIALARLDYAIGRDPAVVDTQSAAGGMEK